MICVDASVVAKWIFTEGLADLAEALYQDTITDGERIVAPALLPIEITNLIRQRMRRTKPIEDELLTLTEGIRHLEQFLSFGVQLSVLPEVHKPALELASLHGLPAVYDAHYVALAKLLDCPLWTADEGLVNALQKPFPNIRWLGDYERSTER